MVEEIENSGPGDETELSVYKCLSEFRKPLFHTIINSLHVPAGSKGLDAACGIGYTTAILAQTLRENGCVTGLDLSKDLIDHARNNYHQQNLEFITGDINSLPFSDNSFDWIWSMDTVWPGPKEFGCPAEDPATILKEYYRVIKPGGVVYILFWSSQKLLPGYPGLEARLNTISSALAPFREGMDTLRHFMNGAHWLYNVGFQHIVTKTFAADITAPISRNDQHALNILFSMLWSASETEATQTDRQVYSNLCDPHSDTYILNNPHYYGFYTYTLFQGNKQIQV